MVRLLLLLVGIVLLAGAGCVRAGGQGPATGQAQLLEGFENDPLWTIDSANDYATLSPDRRDATQGACALRIDVADNGRGKALIRKEVDLDLTAVHALALDALLPAVPPTGSTTAVTMALGLHTVDGGLFETPPQALAPGWNRGLRFPLDGGRAFVAGTDLAHWQAQRSQIDRLVLEIAPAKGDCTVIVDNLTAEGTALQRRDQARILAIEAPAQPVPRWGLAQLNVDVAFPVAATLTPAALDPWMARMDAVQARWAGPDGKVHTVAGFCTGITPSGTQAVYHYGVRLPTPVPGACTYQIGVTAGGGMSWAAPGVLTVGGSSASPGPIHRDRNDPRWLAREDGSWFYPLGENVAWSGDYEPYARAIAAAGGTALRVWICPWNNPLDVDGHLEAVHFANAERIDALFACAHAHHLAVQLCLTYHGALGWDWARCPFNSANGGPCTDPREFWSSPTARDRFHHLLDYCVARWGASPDLLAWELCNEVDLTPRFTLDSLLDWHRDMAAYLHQIDPLGHLVTTSVASPGSLPELWSTGVDLIEVHDYAAQPVPHVQAVSERFAQASLPVLLAEWGRGGAPRDDQHDLRGDALRQALWTAWMGRLAGAPWPWWWDTAIEPDHLLDQVAHLAAFVQGEDPRGEPWRTTTVALAPTCSAMLLLGRDHAYAYLCDPTEPDRSGAAVIAPLLPTAKTLHLNGLAPGAWHCEWWDPRTGERVRTHVLVAAEAGIDVELLPDHREVALKLVRTHALAPGISTR